MRRIDVAIAVVCRDDQLLICRRKQEDRFGGYWEFPGGKREPEETIAQCLARELREELEIEAEPIVALPVIEHDYPDIHVRLHPFICAHKLGEPRAVGCAEAKWVAPAGLREHRFPEANGDLIEQVIRQLTGLKGD